MPPITRINNIDLLRGIVMIIMALDHTRDFFHAGAFTDNPLNLQTTTPLLFFTRWITHICAPTFVFLSGTAAYCQRLRKTTGELSGFLFKRGLWLVGVEVIVITFGITFNISYSSFILQVIWAIGVSMIVLSLAVRLPFYVILVTGIVIVAGHNLLDIYEASHTGAFPVWYQLLHRQGGFPLTPYNNVMIFYPVLPWIGVMLLGYCFGRFYLADAGKRHKRAFVLGSALIAAFVVLRWFDVYGDPLKWSEQKNALYTFFSFINTQKYPPSLLYLCITVGIALVILGITGNARNRLTDAVTIYGRVPLFYYVLHFYILHIVSAIFYLSRGHTFKEGLNSPEFRFLAIGEGYGLGVVYLVWILVVLFLYPLCRWYAGYKAEQKKWWLSYL